MVCRTARRLESDARFLAGDRVTVSARAEVLARPDPAGRYGSWTMARAGGRRPQVHARAKTRHMVLRTPRQEGIEEFAFPARLSQSGSTRLPRPGDGKNGERSGGCLGQVDYKVHS